MKKKLSGKKFLCLVCLSSLIMFVFSSHAFADAVKVAADPTRIGVGARPLGMGKVGVALGDDVNAIFLNPAGVALLSDWQIMSMTGQFINEVSYLQFGGVYKTDFGTFGLGYVGAGLGADFAKPIIFDGRVIASTEGVSYNFNDAVFLLTYGARLSNFFDWDWVKDISVGTNLKMFSVGLSGPDIDGGTASGFDLDLGIVYAPLPWMSVGATGIDVLPADAGGKLTWASGAEEALPSIVKVGAAATVVGQNAPYKYGEHEVIAALDFDIAPTRSELPVLGHFGIEWWPIQYIALRAGVDQDYIGTGTGLLETTNNLTAGVGLLYSGFRFDYAYHQYNDLPENDTHYFSLSYNIWKKPAEAAPPAVVKFLDITSPKDKSITYEEKLLVSGRRIENPKVQKITVNGVNAPIDSSGRFALEVPAKPGKNGVVVVAYDKSGKVLESNKIRVLRLLTFKDVESTYWARMVVEEIATLGIVTGYPDKTFRPDGPITRAEITTLLVRALGKDIPEAAAAVFSDLPSSHWAAKYVREGVKRKYVLGYPDGTFKPSNRINKAEGVVLLARFGELEEPEKVIEAPFPDLPGRHWAAPLVTAAKKAGFLKYLEGRSFEPRKDLTRAEAVEILSKTKFAKGKIQELLDFSTGY